MHLKTVQVVVEEVVLLYTSTLDDGNEITMTDGSVVIEVDTTARHILYDEKWYKKQ